MRHFLRRKAQELKLEEKAFDQAALEALLAYAWPGNVRELENVIERALVLAHGPVMTVEDLPIAISGADPGNRPPPAATPIASPTNGEAPMRPLTEAVEQLEGDLIRRALVEADNNQTRAAEMLGTTRRILKYKMDKLGIDG